MPTLIAIVDNIEFALSVQFGYQVEHCNVREVVQMQPAVAIVKAEQLDSVPEEGWRCPVLVSGWKALPIIMAENDDWLRRLFFPANPDDASDWTALAQGFAKLGGGCATLLPGNHGHYILLPDDKPDEFLLLSASGRIANERVEDRSRSVFVLPPLLFQRATGFGMTGQANRAALSVSTRE